MEPPKTGFAVIYRWRLREGSEARFQEAWATVTRLFLADRGARGSRLHRADDGTWVAYAQWPDRDAWERSGELGPGDPDAMAAMADAIEERFEPVLLEPVADYLAPG